VKTYVALVRLPPARRLIYALSAACLSFGMVSLTLLLEVERSTGSYADGGFAVAAFSIGAGASAPFRGRLIDRHGRRWLLAFAIGFAISLVGLDVVAQLGAATWLLIVLAAVTGVTMPPLFASARAAWPLLVAPAFVRPGYAVTSLLGDIGQVTGPVLAAAVYVATDWAAPIICAAAAVVAAALSVPRAEHLAGPIAPRPMPSLARSRALRALLAVSVMLGIAVGLVQVAVPALSARWNDGSLAGLLLAAFALGSVAGALWYGSRDWRSPVVDRYLVAVLVLGALLAPAALADRPSSLAASLLLAGLAFGPATVSLFETLDVLAPGSGAEALTWVTTAEASGGAAGAALAGIVLRLGGWAPFALGSAMLVVPLAPVLAARARRVRAVGERARA
jgi:MFS family permease